MGDNITNIDGQRNGEKETDKQREGQRESERKRQRYERDRDRETIGGRAAQRAPRLLPLSGQGLCDAATFESSLLL